MGGIFGMVIGAAFVWVPGFGPLFAAGPLAATLIGALEGAAAGAAGMGLLGALLGWGVSEEETCPPTWCVWGKKAVIVHGNEDMVQRAYSRCSSRPAQVCWMSTRTGSPMVPYNSASLQAAANGDVFNVAPVVSAVIPLIVTAGVLVAAWRFQFAPPMRQRRPQRTRHR
ncbi:MAG: hypothetical protein R2873_36530 [Caldilineaceae bacterium]